MKLSPLARLTPLALAVGLSLTACGSDDSSDAGAQGDASAQEGGSSLVAEGDDFCTALMATASVQDGEDVAALHDSLEEAGLPEGAGEDGPGHRGHLGEPSERWAAVAWRLAAPAGSGPAQGGVRTPTGWQQTEAINWP